MKHLGLLGMFALAACQSSTAKDEQQSQEAQSAVVASPTHADCDKMPWNSAKSNCESSYEAASAEAAIEPVYQTLLSTMDAADREWAAQKSHIRNNDPSYREALVQSQAAWIRFRDAQCWIEMYQWRGGASEEQRGNICALRMNRERLTQLQQMQREF